MMIKTSDETETPYREGFTLVETLVAVAILAIGLLAVATMISRSAIQDARAYHMTIASLLIEEHFENASRLQYDVNDFRNMTGNISTTTINGVAYTMNCAIANNTPIDKCKEMTCSVSWNNKGIQASTEYIYVYSPKY